MNVDTRIETIIWEFKVMITKNILHLCTIMSNDGNDNGDENIVGDSNYNDDKDNNWSEHFIDGDYDT